MATTPFMNLEIPTVSVTIGPDWATELNAAFDLIDAHNHASGNGVPIPVAGLNINANLSFDGNKAYDLFSTQYEAISVPLTGASNANSVSVSGGNLYYTNGSGVSVQITSGGSVVSVPASTNTLEYSTLAGNLTIDPSDTFVTIATDTTSSRTVTLPLASAVATGRFYVIKDSSGNSNANPLTLAAAGSDLIDGEVDQTLQSDYGSIWVQSDGVSKWDIL